MSREMSGVVMKVGLLTVHQSVNCGASLQAGALYKSLEEIGHEVEIINYRPYYFVGEVEPGKKLSVKHLVKRALIGKRLHETQSKFTEYQKLCFPKMSNPITSHEKLIEANFDYDLAVCGSDQIWNPPHINYDRAWFFDFLTQTESVSYAASIGKDHLTGDEMEWLRESLSGFTSVGVREDTAVNLLAGMGIRSTLCVDPTLLRPKKEWQMLEKAPENTLPDKYIFYYPLQKNPGLESELLLELKKETHLPCVALSDSLIPPTGADVRLTGFGPREFLYSLSHAEYVFTNSFHGLVFSII